MPVYTEGYDFCVTIPNDIKESNSSPFVTLGSGKIQDPTFVDGVGNYVYEVTRPFTPSIRLAPNELADNHKRIYYRNLYSAPSTAGYTDMEQHLFVSKANVITGWQNKSS